MTYSIPAADHPRACGEHTVTVIAHAGDYGSSPRLRGTSANGEIDTSESRIIPAPAGNTFSTFPDDRDTADHPRACGEHCARSRWTPFQTGSSPRLRGTPVHCHRGHRRGRIIPAPAGNTRPPILSPVAGPDHPRACGEHHEAQDRAAVAGGSSPRLRGTLHEHANFVVPRRIIPAPAGNTGAPVCWIYRRFSRLQNLPNTFSQLSMI
jgi:predicted lipoprotein with Yx(FWY)xxD motif